MDECLVRLSSDPETFEDECLVAIARIARVDDEIIAACPWRSYEYSKSASSHIPPILFVRTLRASFDEVRKSLRPAVLNSSVYNSYLP